MQPLCFLVSIPIQFWYSIQHFPLFWPVAAENPGSDNLKSSMVIPSPAVRDRVLKELFIEGT